MARAIVGSIPAKGLAGSTLSASAFAGTASDKCESVRAQQKYAVVPTRRNPSCKGKRGRQARRAVAEQWRAHATVESDNARAHGFLFGGVRVGVTPGARTRPLRVKSQGRA